MNYQNSSKKHNNLACFLAGHDTFCLFLIIIPLIGQVGISLSSDWFTAKSGSTPDMMAAATALTFRLGWFAGPLFEGDYPKRMKELVTAKRSFQGFQNQTLPTFSVQEMAMVKGLYYYFLYLCDYKVETLLFKELQRLYNYN